MINETAYEIRCRELLESLDIVPTPSVIAQLDVMIGALLIYAERNGRYKDIWNDMGWRGVLFDLRKKMVRIWRVFTTKESKDLTAADYECDDAYDLINYGAIFLRSLRLRSEHGEAFDDTP